MDEPDTTQQKLDEQNPKIVHRVRVESTRRGANRKRRI